MSHKVKIKYDPTAPRLMRWSAEIQDASGRYITCKSCCISRRSAERQADRYISRLPGKRAYTYQPKGN